MAGLLKPDAVETTLLRWAREPFEWGHTDCALSIFRYISDHWGEGEPFRFWVHRYTCEKSAKAILRQWGGPVAMFRKQMIIVRAKRTRYPQRGDIGLVRDGSDRLVCALCVGGGRWAAKTGGGFTVFVPDWIAAWNKE